MVVTVEEIVKAVEEQPDLKTSILSSFKDDFIKSPPPDVIVRTKEEDQKFLENHTKAVVEERVKKEVQKGVDEQFGTALSKIDESIKEITGIDKQPNEKTTAYAKRAIEEKRQSGDPITKEKVVELEGMLKTTKKDYEEKLKEKDNQLFTKEIEWNVNGELDKVNIALPVHLKTDEEKQKYISHQKALIKQDFLKAYQPKKDEQGNIIFYKGEQPLLNTKDGKAKSAGELISEEFAPWFVPQGQTATGTGTGHTNGSIPSGGFKNKEDIHKYLGAQGIDALTKEYQDQFSKLATENKIDI